MNRYLNKIIYYLHKIQKKLRFSGVRNSIIHPTSALESGTSFISSSLGKYSFCGYDCDIYFTEIGSFCSIASGVVIGGNAHPIEWVSTSPVFYNNVDTIKKKFSRHEREPSIKTIIGNDVWVGRNALIKQGVTVGTGAVIGMGAVVTKDVEPYSIVGGNPAALLKMRFSSATIKKLINSKWWDCSDERLHSAASAVRSSEEFIKYINTINGERN